MSKKLIIGIIVGLLVIVGGVAAYTLINGDDSTDSSSPSSSSNESALSGDDKQFSPIPTTDQAFVATMSGTTSNNKSYSATIEADGKGTTHYTSDSGSEPLDFYYSADSYIYCTEKAGCFKFGKLAPTTDQVPSQYEYSEEDFDSFKSIANYTGSESCPAGSCDVWEISKDGYTTKVFIGNDNRVSKLTTEGPEGKFAITYEYKDVTITLPSNVKTLPTP